MVVPLLQLVSLEINVTWCVQLDRLQRRTTSVAAGDISGRLRFGPLLLPPLLFENHFGGGLRVLAVEEEVAAGGGGGAGALGLGEGGGVGGGGG